MMTRGIKGAVFYGMVITAIVGMIFNLIEMPHKVVDAVPSLAPTFGAAFSSFGDSSFYSTAMLGIVLTFLFVDFFDNAGTLVAVANQAGMMKDNKLPRAGGRYLLIRLPQLSVQYLEHRQQLLILNHLQGLQPGQKLDLLPLVTAGFLSYRSSSSRYYLLLLHR